MRKQLLLAAVMTVVGMVSGAVGQTEKGSPRDRTTPVKAGETAPDFTLAAANGKSISLSKLNKLVVLVFYRGYWCPFCVRQLADLRGLITPGENVELIAVSIDPPEKSKELAAKIGRDGKGEVGFTLLSDPGHKTIDAYGLYDPAYAGQDFDGIPHPAVYVLDKNRKVVWAKVESDYKKRPTNEEIRAALSLTSK